MGGAGTRSVLIVLLSTLTLAGCDSADPCPFGCLSLPVEQLIAMDSYPAWGPDGQTIAYNHVAQTAEELALGGRYQIWLLDVGTGERRFLTVGSLPAWSPDGKRLAFVRSEDIHMIKLATGEVTRLTEWGECFFPDWSPNGEWIAFDTNHEDPRGANVIWVMRADGSEKTDISEHGVGEWREPMWSPNGEWILHIRYVSEEDNPSPELFLMHPDGTAPFRLTSDTWGGRSPRWSPNGQMIAWALLAEGRENPADGIWSMNADGSHQRQITEGGMAPSWAPDGTRLIFFDTRPDPARADSLVEALYVVDADGTDRRQLTRVEDYRE